MRRFFLPASTSRALTSSSLPMNPPRICERGPGRPDARRERIVAARVEQDQAQAGAPTAAPGSGDQAPPPRRRLVVAAQLRVDQNQVVRSVHLDAGVPLAGIDHGNIGALRRDQEVGAPRAPDSTTPRSLREITTSMPADFSRPEIAVASLIVLPSVGALLVGGIADYERHAPIRDSRSRNKVEAAGARAAVGMVRRGSRSLSAR